MKAILDWVSSTSNQTEDEESERRHMKAGSDKEVKLFIEISKSSNDWQK